MPRAGPQREPRRSLLGLAIGTLAAAGRDKLTFIADPEIAELRWWLEQLIAESTGKQGMGIVPVDSEPLRCAPATTARIGRSSRSASPRAAKPSRRKLADAGSSVAGQPVIRIELPDPIDLGGRDRPLGGRDGDRRHRPGHRSVRPAQRRGGQGAHPAACSRASAGRGRGRRGRGAHASAWRSGPTTRWQARLRRDGLRALEPGGYVAMQAYMAPSIDTDAAHRAHAASAARRTGLRDDGRLRPALPAFDRPAAQGRPGDRLVPPADSRPSGRPADPRLAVHLRAAHRRAGAGRLGGARAHDRPVLRVHLGADLVAGLGTLERRSRARLA